MVQYSTIEHGAVCYITARRSAGVTASARQTYMAVVYPCWALIPSLQGVTGLMLPLSDWDD